MAKAANGEGTKLKLPNGKWRAAVYVPMPDGTKKRVYRQFRTRKEADEWLSKIKSEISAGKPVMCSDQSFGDYLEEWFFVPSSYMKTKKNRYVPSLAHNASKVLSIKTLM